MKKTFIAICSAGPHRDRTRETREQPLWDEHAAFIDDLVDQGFIVMGGPLDEGGSLLVLEAESEADVREKLSRDPWHREGILELESTRRWSIFIDARKQAPR